MSVIEEKAALRREYLLYRGMIPPQIKQAIDSEIAAQVIRNSVYLTANTVFCYVSLPQEIATHPILMDSLQRGKRVAVPRCRANGEMDFHLISSVDDLEPGMLGISEPKRSCLRCIPSFADVCIVPCLAADRRGFRLGYGGGYYDRYLSANPVRTIGLCYSACLTDRLPTDPFDVRIQTLITDKEVLEYG